MVRIITVAVKQEPY